MKIVLIVMFSLVLVLGIVVLSLPSERSYSKSEIINANVEKVFSIVTNLEQQSWRTEAPEIQISDETPGAEIWTEKPKHGPEIKFRTRVKNTPALFVIEIIDNPHYGGQWTGRFYATDDNQTRVEFTEMVSLNGLVSKLFSYLLFDIKKTVDQYVADLKMESEK